MAESTHTPIADSSEEPLDPRVVEWIKNNCGPNNYGEQDENGIDLSLIRGAMKLSEPERFERADRMLTEFRYLKWMRDNGRFQSRSATQNYP